MIYQPKPKLGMQLNRKHQLADGLIGCWIFNEATGDKVFDLSGQGNDGTIVGADWVPNGLDFVSANDDYIQLDNKIVFADGEPWTIVSLVDLDLLVNYYGLAGNEFDTGKYARLMGFGSGTVAVYNDANSNVAITGVGQTGEHQFIFTCDDISTITGYRDGLYINNATQSGVYSFYRLFSIGSTTNFTLDGRGKSTYIYNRALSTYEVAWLNREPYAMFQKPINPAMMYYEAAGAFLSVWAKNINNLLEN